MNKEACCPVCGVRTETVQDIQCPACGFDCMMPQPRFAGAEGAKLWKKKVETGRQHLLMEMQNVCRQNRLLFYRGGESVITMPGSGHVIRVGAEDLTEMGADIRQFSAPDNSGRNGASLNNRGEVETISDDYFHQNARSMTGIRFVLATANCTYGVTREGTVLFSGQPASESVTTWHNVRYITGTSELLAAITTDGRVLIAGYGLRQNAKNEVEHWNGILEIASADDAVIGLKQNGTVVFAGNDAEDPRSNVRTWTDIQAVALDGNYAIGLRKDGHVLLAGEKRNEYLDMGRSEAENWTDIIAISACRTGIGAIAMDGTIHLVGNLYAGNEIIKNWESQREDFCREMLTAIRGQKSISRDLCAG